MEYHIILVMIIIIVIMIYTVYANRYKSKIIKTHRQEIINLDNYIKQLKAEIDTKNSVVNQQNMYIDEQNTKLEQLEIDKEQLINYNKQLELDTVQLEKDKNTLKNKLKKLATTLKSYRQFIKDEYPKENLQYLIEIHILELSQYIDSLKSNEDRLKSNIQALKLDIQRYKETMLKGTFTNSNISDEELYIQLLSISILDRLNPIEDSQKFKELLSIQRDNSKLIVKADTACRCFSTVPSLATKQIKNLKKIMVFVFDSICDRESINIRYNNLQICEKRIIATFNKINKLFEDFGYNITNEYLNSKLIELSIEHKYQEVKRQEKLEIQEINKQIREEKRKQKEIEKRQKELEEQIEKELEQQRIRDEYKQQMEKEVEQIKNSLEIQSKLKVDNELAIQNIETNKLRVKLDLLEKEIKTLQESQDTTSSIEEQIIDLERQKEVMQSGFVYIISNVGAFGENIFKIGVTRRDNPLKRVDELSSASVPFKFSVHAIIPSDQAYNLEYKIHKRLNKYRVNLINNRKEFFNINKNELIDILKEEVGIIDFNTDIVDEQYSQSLDIRQDKDKFNNWLNNQDSMYNIEDEDESIEISDTYKILPEYLSILKDMQTINQEINIKVTKYYISFYLYSTKICTFYKCGDAKKLLSFSIEGYESDKTSGTRQNIKIAEYYQNKEEYINIIKNILNK